MSKSRDIADSAATINYIDGVTSNVQSQLNTLTTAVDNISVTNGSLTKTFTAGESSEITLSSSVLAPVVSVIKEIPQTGVTNNNWDAAAGSYALEDSAYATSLSFAYYAISTASFVDSFSVSSQEVSPTGLAFNTNGTKMFVLGTTGDDVNEYTLSTAFDVSTASYSQNFSVAAQETSPFGLAFNTDGTKMFVCGWSGVDVNEYSLSTGFDVSTASFTQLFSVSVEITNPSGIAFNADGTKMFVVDAGGLDVNEYTLSTGFNVSTALFVDAFSVAAQDTSPLGIAFNTAGTKMFIVGSTGADVNEYDLSTGFDVSTAVYSTLFSVAAQDTSPRGISFNTDGTKMFVVGATGTDVNEYTLSFSLALGTGSFASTDVGKTINVNDGVLVLTATDGSIVETTAPTSYDTAASGEWSMFGVVYDASADVLELSNYSDTYNLAVASYDSVSFSVSSQDYNPNGIRFNNDGSKMFIVGLTDFVYEYALSTNFDISTASFTTSFSVSAKETTTNALAFNNDGTKMYILGSVSDAVHEYSLSTAFSISTASFSSTFSVSPQELAPQGLAFSTDGSKMYVVGTAGDDVNEYSLSTPFNISTASFTTNFSVSAQEISPMEVIFNADGTKMFIAGDTFPDSIYQYSLSTAFDVSTASFTESFSVNAQETAPNGLTFNDTGTKMYIVGRGAAAVYQYSVGSIFISTGYQPAISSNIDSTYWTDINSLTATNAIGSGNVFYAVSNDARDSWSVLDNTDGVRDIVRNNAGTWQYNSNATYTSETWANASTNTEVAALREAMEGATALGAAYDIAQASYDSKSFSFSSQETLGRGIAFNSDGTKVYIVGLVNDTVYQYSLSTAYDISTASYDTISFSVASQDLNPTAITFNTDGTKMYIAGTSNDTVYQYTLSTAYNVGTASYDSVSLNVSSQATAPNGLIFKPDGTALYVSDGNSPNGFQYTLTTAFDLSTASYSSKTFNWSSETAVAVSLQLNDDGTKAYILDIVNEKVLQYSLSTAYDLSTATYSSVEFSVLPEMAAAETMVFAPNGSKLYVIGTTATIYQYSTQGVSYTNQMDSTALNAITDANQITLGDDLDFAAILYYNTGSTVPTYSGTAINYDANILNQGAVLGTDYNFDAPAGNKVRITAVGAGNYKVRVV